MSAIDLVIARLKTEEGKRAFAYNDATGKRVTCQPGGNLTIGYGINLEPGLDDAEQDWLLAHRVSLVDQTLQQFGWYGTAGDARDSVFLDVGFNDGVHALLHFPRMLAAAAAGDWPTAAAELLDSAAARALPDRYKPLADLLTAGG